MSIEACAALVARGDPERFAAVMAAPLAARARLWPLYAFNLEIARAPWVTQEPLIAEMRLQWWRDVVAGGAVRAHEVAGPLAALIAECDLPVAVLEAMVEARRHDANRGDFADQAALDAYLEASGAGLMWLAARALGAGPAGEAVARGVGWASALAGYLRAVPALEARGLRPLVEGQAAAVSALAERGLARLGAARQLARRGGARALGPGRAALLAGWQAEGLLARVVADPGLVARGGMGLSEFARRGGLLWQAWTGRF